MAPKRPSPLEEPPNASSPEERPSPLEEPPNASSPEEHGNEVVAASEEEEAGDGESEGEFESESESDEDEDEEQSEPEQSQKKPSSPPLSAAPSAVEKNPNKRSQSSFSDSDSDSDHPPPSVVDASKVNKSKSDPKAAVASTSAAPTKSAVKRQVENNVEEKEAKRVKKVEEAEIEEKKPGRDVKKQLFQRLWSENDEITILQGMLEYASQTGSVPAADLTAFHDFIRKSLLHVDFSRAQLIDKIRRLKKKFNNKAGKGVKGTDKTLSKPHDQKTFDLSKKLWGKEARNNKVPSADQAKSNGRNIKNIAQVDFKGTPPKMTLSTFECSIDSSGFSNGCGLNENFMKEGMKLISSSKKSELEEKWRKLHMAETEFFLKRIELVREQTKLVLDSYKD